MNASVLDKINHDFAAAIAIGIMGFNAHAVLHGFQIGAMTQRYIE